MPKLRSYLVLLLAAPLFCLGVAHASTIFLKARLDGAQAGVVTSADGSAFLSYDTATRLLSWTVNYRGLSSAANAAHIHGPGGPGVIAAIVVPFTLTASPLTGSATITLPQQADLMSGLWYVNIHSVNHPDGEIRGQISRITTTIYEAPLDGAQAGTAGSPLPTSGSGSGTVTFDPATMALAWNFTYANLPSGVIASHFHGPAQPFEVAAVEVPATITNPIVGNAVLTADLAAQLVNGFMYFNVHTNDFPGGEIRGQVVPADPPRMAALSTRMQVLTGDNVAIGGFIIGGSSSKTVVVRARGPSLAGTAGIVNPLSNPLLQIVSSASSTVVASSDDWGSAANAPDITAFGFQPGQALESAVLATLPPGGYTAIVTGVGGVTGVGIVEIFELNEPAVPLVGISTRGEVLTDNDVMIGGFIIQGSGQQRVIIRARGPSLAGAVASPVLANPTLTLVRSSDGTVIATNDDWQLASNYLDIQASGLQPGDPAESAILISLDPGAYTAIVSGVGGSTGVGLVEVFTAP